MDKRSRFRLTVQAVAALVQNAHFSGFITGRIYEGPGKNFCVPGLNCYSCPGAVGSCPIGSLQAGLSGLKFRFPYYIVGLLIFFGVLLGRAVCGFLCPFGLIQDLLHRIPFPKKIHTFRGDRKLRKVKYLVLIILVIALPLAVKLTPAFCKYFCPAGTLSGILLAVNNSPLLQLMSGRFFWKIAVLAAVVLFSIMISRPFCRYLCPLGAVYAPFNKVSMVRLSLKEESCIRCGACERSCPMAVNPAVNPNDGECIRCGKCISACPAQALAYASLVRKKKKENPDSVKN